MKKLTFSALTLALLAGCSAAPDNETQAVETQAALTATDTQRIVDVIVHSSVYASLTTDLATLKADMQSEGWTVQVSQFSGTAPQLRTQLATQFTQTAGKLAGVFLIGEIARPMADNCWNDGNGPGNADYYYMDLDGDWRDDDGDGDFDYQAAGTGDRTPEIFAGRLVGTNVTLYGKTEVELLRGYLKRDHAFRKGTSPGTGQSAFINQTGFGDYPGVPQILQEQAKLFPNTTVVTYDHTDGYADLRGLASQYAVSTPANVLRSPLYSIFQSEIAAGFDFMHVTTHGFSSGLMGMGESADFARVSMAGGQLPRFINVHSCLTARIGDPNSIAATAVLGGTLGYLGFGTVSYYPPEWDTVLMQGLKVTGATMGEALKAVHQYAYNLDPAGTSVAWTSANYYLLGDPTLRPIYKIVPPAAPTFVNTQKLEAWMIDGGSNAQGTAVRVFIKNVGTAPVSLATKKLQFVFNMGEFPGKALALDDNYTPSSAVSVVSLADGLHPLRFAIQFDFSAFQGTLAPGASTSLGTSSGESVRVHFADWALGWQEGDDYSATGKTATWAVSKNLNIYDGSTLIYGYK